MPKWNETFSLLVAPEMMSHCHLFFTLRQCFSSNSKELGNAFLKLTKSDETVIDDGCHTIIPFKYQKGDASTFYLKEGGFFLFFFYFFKFLFFYFSKTYF